MPNDISKLRALADHGKDNSVSAPADNNDISTLLPPFILNKAGKIINDLRNATIFLEYCLPDCIQLNEFTDRIEIGKPVPWAKDDTSIRTWTDTDTCNALMYANEYGLSNKKNIEDAVHIVADRNKYHPIKDYLNRLQYKGDGYIRRLFVEYMGCADTEYTYECVKLLLIAMIQRVFHPGCKYDYVLILVGNQGTYKSSMFRVLSRDDAWFTDSVDSFGDRKKLGELLQGKWLVELGEMSAFKKSEIESIKAAITTQVDSYREAYGHFRADFNRTAVFVGTTNNRTFLKDATGNRRFLVLPIDETKRTKDLFKSKTRNEDFDGALAEALHIYQEQTKDGSLIPLVLPASVIGEAQERQNNANYFEEWTGIIEPWLEDQIKNGISSYTSALDIWRNCFNRDDASFSKNEAYRINQILDSLECWHRVTSVRIIRKSREGHIYFDYRGRGFRYELPDEIQF